MTKPVKYKTEKERIEARRRQSRESYEKIKKDPVKYNKLLERLRNDYYRKREDPDWVKQYNKKQLDKYYQRTTKRPPQPKKEPLGNIYHKR